MSTDTVVRTLPTAKAALADTLQRPDLSLPSIIAVLNQARAELTDLLELREADNLFLTRMHAALGGTSGPKKDPYWLYNEISEMTMELLRRVTSLEMENDELMRTNAELGMMTKR